MATRPLVLRWNGADVNVKFIVRGPNRGVAQLNQTDKNFLERLRTTPRNNENMQNIISLENLNKRNELYAVRTKKQPPNAPILVLKGNVLRELFSRGYMSSPTTTLEIVAVYRLSTATKNAIFNNNAVPMNIN